MDNQTERRAWVQRVLGIMLAEPPMGRVAYAKLLIEWRGAQARVMDGIASIGAAILARDDVKADPRLHQVEAAVRAMPSLLPQFGSELEDLVDAAMTAGPGEAAAASLKAAQQVIPRYRAMLQAATRLSGLEKLANAHLGNGPVLMNELDSALGRLETELATRTGGA